MIDGILYFHLVYQSPSNLAADYLLRQVSKQRGMENHLVFDKTVSPSIKDAERTKRSNQQGMVWLIR